MNMFGVPKYTVNRALLGGCMLWTRRLGGYSATTRRLNDGNTLPHALGGRSPGLHWGPCVVRGPVDGRFLV
jgi:hypothetical protein